jgi:hypothetical protein
MKRGIEVCPGYDVAGDPVLHIEKPPGDRVTLYRAERFCGRGEL